MDFFGRVAQGVGRAYDYATPGSGTSSLTQFGRTAVGDGTEYTNAPVIGNTAVDGALYFNQDTGQLEQYGGGSWKPMPSQGQVQGASVTKTPAVDPYAKYGGASGYAALKSGVDASASSIAGGARTGFNDVYNEYDTKSKGFVQTQQDTQDEINRSGANNQLNLRGTMQNIVRGVQTGLRSGGVALANMGASDSGAADAMARAYAKVGNQQTGEAQGEAALTFEDLQRQQGVLDRTRKEGETTLDTWKNTESTRVRQDFTDKILALQAKAQADGLGVDTNVVNTIADEAVARLSEIDRNRAIGMQGVQQWNPEQIMAEAIRMEQLGQTGNPFAVTDANVSYGRGAPVASQMPLYLRGRDEITAPVRKEQMA